MRTINHIAGMAIVCAMALASAGCDGRRDGIKDTIAEMREHPVALPLDRMQCRYGGSDTVMRDSVKPVLRMVVYLDSAYCTPCALDRMRRWNGLIADAARYKGRLRYVFIAAPRPEQTEDTYFSIDDSQLDSPVYVDTAYAMRSANPHLPDGNEYHSFLIDADGNVLFVGNPLGGKELGELYNKTVRSNINN